MTICAKHNASHGIGFQGIFLILLFLSVPQTAAVGPVLGVNKQLHLELDSYHGLGSGLFGLLNGFNFCLENKILVIIF